MTRGTILKFLAALAITGAWPVMPASAQSTPQQCAAIAADPERLACYDALFAGTGAVPAGDAVTLQSQALIPARPSGRGSAEMVVSCDSGGPVVSFTFAGQLVSATGDIAPVTFQLDAGGTAVRTLLPDGTNTRLSFAPGRESNTFLDTLAGATSLKVRVTPVRQRSLTVDFRVNTVADQIAAVRANCG